MRKVLLLLLISYGTYSFSQEHWEDNFWRDQAKKRYAQTLSMAGFYTEFYENGQIKWQGYCLENGNPDGRWVYYNENGVKCWEGEYNGKHYEYKPFDKYGAHDQPPIQPDTAVIGNYKNGLKEGEWQEYDYDGKFIYKKGQYLKGQPTGLWQEFSEVTVATKIFKIYEYNYTTETRTHFKKDSIEGTQHIDSLSYNNLHGINNDVFDNYTSNSDSYSVNICLLGTAQFINLNALNDYFHSSPYSKLSSPLSSIGFEMSGISVPSWSYAINWTPAISAQVNDSIRLRLSGWNSSFSFGGDLIKAKAVDIVPTLGIGFQQLKLKVLNIQNPNLPSNSFQENDFKIYRNSSPTLNGMLNIRINMSSFTINLAGGYILDGAGQKWRYNGQYLKNSPKTSVSGFVASVSIGIHIHDF